MHRTTTLWFLLGAARAMCPLLNDCATTLELPCDLGNVCPVGSFEQRICPAGYSCPTPALQIPCRNASTCPPGSTQDLSFPIPGAAVFGSVVTIEIALADLNVSAMQLVRDNIGTGCNLCVIDPVWVDAQGNLTYCDNTTSLSDCLYYTPARRLLLQPRAYALFLVLSEGEFRPTFEHNCPPPCINFTIRANAPLRYDPTMRRRDVARLVENYFTPAPPAPPNPSSLPLILGLVGGGVVALVACVVVQRRTSHKTQIRCMFEGVRIDLKQ